MTGNLQPVPGSERTPLPGATVTGPVDQNETLEITLVLKRSAAFGECVARATDSWPGERLSREEFAEKFSASQTDCAAVRVFAKTHDLTVVAEDRAAHTVRLRGTVNS